MRNHVLHRGDFHHDEDVVAGNAELYNNYLQVRICIVFKLVGSDSSFPRLNPASLAMNLDTTSTDLTCLDKIMDKYCTMEGAVVLDLNCLLFSSPDLQDLVGLQREQ